MIVLDIGDNIEFVLPGRHQDGIRFVGSDEVTLRFGGLNQFKVPAVPADEKLDPGHVINVFTPIDKVDDTVGINFSTDSDIRSFLCKPRATGIDSVHR